VGLKILAQMANTKCVSGMVELALHSREAFRKLYASVFVAGFGSGVVQWVSSGGVEFADKNSQQAD